MSKPTPQNNSIKSLKAYLKPLSGQIIWYIIFSLLSVLFMLCTVLSVRDFLNMLFPMGKQVEATSINKLTELLNSFYVWLISFGKSKAILYFSMALFSFYALKNVFGYFSSRVMVSIRSKIIRNIRNSLYGKMLKLPLSFYGRSRKGDIISRFSNDVAEYDEAILKSYHQLTIAIITILVYVVTLFYISTPLTLFVLLFLPASGLLISRISRKLRRQSLHVQQRNSFLLSLTEEAVSGLRIIKAYTAIDFFNARFKSYNESYTRLRNTVYRRVDMASPISDFLGNFTVIVILLFGARIIFSGDSDLTAAMFVVYIILFTLVINPVKDVSTAISNLKKGRAIANRITNVLNEDEYIYNKKDSISIQSFNNNITFKNVFFSYNKVDTVLNNIDLTIEKGKLIAVVGPSGAGKSTLVDLIVRFYDVTGGQVVIDGENIKNLSIESVRNLMGFVTQDTILFNDTILNNIALGVSYATEEKIIEASKIANAHEFISQMERGYHTQIGDRGDRLSGGQRQRISIARAVLKNPPILILDEATSALDTESERLVQDALSEIMKNRTSIVIAHRLSTIQHADEIIVMDKGEIVQRGTHTELVNKEGLYQKLCNMQIFN